MSDAATREHRNGARPGRVFEGLLQDARHALRGVRREPGFAAIVILTFGLAVGANTAMFGITDRLLLRPPAHVQDPERVVRIGIQQRSASTGELTTSTALAYADYADLREQVAGFTEVGAVTSTRDASLGVGPDAELIRATPASASFFRALGVQPALGRFFLDEETAAPAGEAVAVLGDRLWREHYGSDPAVLGQTLEVDQTVYTIVGVAPPGFNGGNLMSTDVWLPFTVFGAPSFEGWHLRGGDMVASWLFPVARLAAGVAPEAAAAEATVLLAGLYPQQFEADPDRAVVLGHLIAARSEGFSGAAQRLAARVSLWLMAVAGVVLLIACANVANLLMGRALRRRRELGVRLALGIGRRRLAGHVFAEALLLAGLGALLGLVLAHWGGPLIRDALLPGFEWQDSPLDPRLLLFTLTALLVAVVVATAAPLVLVVRTDTAALLKTGSRSVTGRGSRLRSGLVVAQGALCVLLLVGAGLFVHSLRNAHAVELGVAGPHLVYANLPGTPASHYEEALERVRALPGVADAALAAATLPFRGGMSIIGVRAPGVDSIGPPASQGVFRTHVGPGYFSAAGTPILRGRPITAADVDGGEPVAVVSQAMAQGIWGREDPIGRCFILESDLCVTVVGIAGDTRRAVGGDPVILSYRPLAQTTGDFNLTLLVRTTGDPSRVLPLLRGELQALDAGMRAVQLTPLRDLYGTQLRPWRLGATLFTAFGILALVLAALGLYAVIAYDVAQRRREMGVRLALGASAGNVTRLVLAGAGRVSGTGIVLGLAAALLLAPRLEPLLFGVDPRQVGVYAAVGGVLLLVGFVAALVPAARAVRVDPMEVIRTE
jgi:predicted permease